MARTTLTTSALIAVVMMSKKANDRADAAERTAVSLRGAVTKLKTQITPT